MRGRRGTDRLAVWTFERDGEQIANGDPSVTDEERAAAGRQTLVDLSRALIESNRRRAAAAYEAGGVPDGRELVRVWRRRDLAELRSRLGERPFVAWAEDDVLHVLWRGRAGGVAVVGGVQPLLWPVDGADDLWEASLRVRRLDEAVIALAALPHEAGAATLGPPRDAVVWRGPRAPALPDADPEGRLAGSVEEEALDSPALGGSRGVTVYRPPGHDGPLPGCVLADGEAVPSFARTLEPAILSGAVPPLLLVGVHSGFDAATPFPDRRAQEYLPGQHAGRFADHLRFVADEVVPWAAARHGAAARPWAAAGFSNGGAWAIAAAQRRPDLFGAVAAFSAGITPRRVSRNARAAGVRHYLAAGTLETGFRDATRSWADRLRRAGLECQHQEWVGGHDHNWWEARLPAALGWLLPKP